MLRMDEMLQRSDMLLEGIADDGGDSFAVDPDDEVVLGEILRRQDDEARRERLRDEHRRALAATSAQLDQRMMSQTI